MTMTANEMILSRGLEHDLPMMEKYISLTHPDLPSKHISFAEYLMHWNREKEAGGLFKLLGGKLMVSKQVTYERSDKEMRCEMDNSSFYSDSVEVQRAIKNLAEDVIEMHVMGGDDRRYLIRYFADCCGRPPYRYTEDALEHNPDIATFYLVSSMLAERVNETAPWLCNEIYGESYGAATLPGCSKKLLLPRGIKPVRAVNRFIDFMRAYCKEVRDNDAEFARMIDTLVEKLEILRQTVSMVTNTRKLTGNLTISIHPFDYMTMSDPDNGWTSCMRWEDDDPGEYHAGTLEMMTSSSVLVAYLESKERINPAGMEETWNKKKWRELFVVDKKFLSGIKGYPYKSTVLEDLVFEMISDLAAKNWGVTFDTRNIMDISDDGILGMQLETNFMYNDWAYNSTRAIVANGIEKDSLPNTYYYGDTCYCLVCGGSRGNYEEDEGNAEVLWCEGCDGAEVCPICGRREHHSLIEAPDGQRVCEYCLDNYYTCVQCGAQHYYGDMHEFEIRYHRHGGWTHRYSFYVCDDHARDIQTSMCSIAWGDYTHTIGRLDENTFKWLQDHVPEFFRDYCEDGFKIEAQWNGTGEKPDVVEG